MQKAPGWLSVKLSEEAENLCTGTEIKVIGVSNKLPLYMVNGLVLIQFFFALLESSQLFFSFI